MDTNDTGRRLNPLIPGDLADLGQVPDIDEIFGDLIGAKQGNLGILSYLDRDRLREDLKYLVRDTKRKENRDLIYSQAWRCTHIFTHKTTDRVCNTINGTYDKKPIIRKRCRKCCQDRTNPKTFQQELLEVAGVEE